jgi:catechol 2,3-dioxygenase-like lactoylglutathione lyase family enzyme
VKIEPMGSLLGVLETSLYFSSDEEEAMRRLYEDVLGLPKVASWSDAMAFRLGSGVLLLFDRDKIVDRDEPLADHGTTGGGHVCFLAATRDYEAWKERISDSGLDITHEESWESGFRSFYFKDAAGNLLEVAEGDLWPRAD